MFWKVPLTDTWVQKECKTKGLMCGLGMEKHLTGSVCDSWKIVTIVNLYTFQPHAYVSSHGISEERELRGGTLMRRTRDLSDSAFRWLVLQSWSSSVQPGQGIKNVKNPPPLVKKPQEWVFFTESYPPRPSAVSKLPVPCVQGPFPNCRCSVTHVPGRCLNVAARDRFLLRNHWKSSHLLGNLKGKWNCLIASRCASDVSELEANLLPEMDFQYRRVCVWWETGCEQ